MTRYKSQQQGQISIGLEHPGPERAIEESDQLQSLGPKSFSSRFTPWPMPIASMRIAFLADSGCADANKWHDLRKHVRAHIGRIGRLRQEVQHHSTGGDDCAKTSILAPLCFPRWSQENALVNNCLLSRTNSYADGQRGVSPSHVACLWRAALGAAEGGVDRARRGKARTPRRQTACALRERATASTARGGRAHAHAIVSTPLAGTRAVSACQAESEEQCSRGQESDGKEGKSPEKVGNSREGGGLKTHQSDSKPKGNVQVWVLTDTRTRNDDGHCLGFPHS